jgi:type IV pilus assembly protein PilA
MKQIQKGFTLIELMIVVAIVGILAAIALPAYQDFVVRSKMSEGLAALAACKTSVQEYASANRGMTPTDSTIAGCSTAVTQFNSGLTITGGSLAVAGTKVNIVVTTQNTGSTLAGAASACILTLASAQSGTFEITSWTPTFSGCDSKYIPSSFR